VSAREPLGPEEQEAADRLREWSVAAPSVALDERILAQARAAVAPPVRRPRPLLVGLASAATLVLAVGVVWRVLEAPSADLPAIPAAMPQMRATDADTATVPEPASAAAGAQPTGEEVATPAPAQRQPDPDARQGAAAPLGRATAVPPPPPPPAEPALPPAEIAEIQAEPAPAPASPPVAPPPPPSPPGSVHADAERAQAPADSASRMASPGAADREQGGAHETRRERGAAAQESPVAAIQRIRALIAAGARAEARVEIERLAERMPGLALPPDLQALASEPER
jgi:hypothetical protein